MTLKYRAESRGTPNIGNFSFKRINAQSAAMREIKQRCGLLLALLLADPSSGSNANQLQRHVRNLKEELCCCAREGQ